ncbi:serine/threonine protein kinase [Frankia sp. CcI49]|uniref:protein kinase domain-containing protein n=1 Tax=Frankia sp. CcI49 TaxID=1745382 RepID=UPI000976864E|nr:protein kinase [Frankia sp. CcI49]ONH56197.1 serine/threonine protein kinase [Frankia sp. CcI49]
MIVDRDRVAKALPGYVLGEQLGSGAFGLVLAGTHRQMGRPVAIKVMEARGTAAAAAGFAAEARVLARLDHSHVVRVYDYVEDHGLCMVVMELLAGGTLTERRATMSPEEICAAALAIAAALEHAHRHKVLHRDIKTDNVMFAGDGTLKVTDFGIAKLFDGSGTTTSGIAGTPAYMAPEQIEGGQLGPWTDLYALGIVLYSLFTGRLPFDPKLPLLALLGRQLSEPPPPMTGVAAPLAEVVSRALAKSPADRPPDAATFALELASAATAVFGVGWAARGRSPLHLDATVRAATERPPGWAHWDFFISYASADQDWADWVAWVLETAGYLVLLQARDGTAGPRWTADVRAGVGHCARTLVLLSDSYLESEFEQAGWGTVRGADAVTLARTLVQVRVENCPRPELPGTMPTLDLFNSSAEAARTALLERATVALAGREDRAGPGASVSLPPTRAIVGFVPLVPPRLPGTTVAPPFPAGPGLPPRHSWDDPPPPAAMPAEGMPADAMPPAAIPPAAVPPAAVPPAAESGPPAADSQAPGMSALAADVVPGGPEPSADSSGARPRTGPRSRRRRRRRRLGRRAAVIGVVVLVLTVVVGALALSRYPGRSPTHPAARVSPAASADTELTAETPRSPSPGPSGPVSPSTEATISPSASSTSATSSAGPANTATRSAAAQAGPHLTSSSINGINGGDDTTQVPGSEADTYWVGDNATCSAWLSDNGSGALAGVLNTSLTQSCVAELFRSDGIAYTFSASWGARKTNFVPVAGYTMWICVWHADLRSSTEMCSPHFGMRGTIPARQPGT